MVLSEMIWTPNPMVNITRNSDFMAMAIHKLGAPPLTNPTLIVLVLQPAQLCTYPDTPICLMIYYGQKERHVIAHGVNPKINHLSNQP